MARPSNSVKLFMSLSVISGLGSCIWLAILGIWWAVTSAVVSVLSPVLLSLLMLCCFSFGSKAIKLFEKKRVVFCNFYLLLGSLITYAGLVAWCLATLFYFISDATTNTFWPLMICSYGVITLPWNYVACMEGSVESRRYAIIIQIIFVVALLGNVFGEAKSFELFMLFMAFVVVGTLYETILQYREIQGKNFIS